VVREVKYFVIYPGGRQRLVDEAGVDPRDDAEAVAWFENHWTRGINPTKPNSRKLIREVREEILEQSLEQFDWDAPPQWYWDFQAEQDRKSREEADRKLGHLGKE
jgi:hypothetical protein